MSEHVIEIPDYVLPFEPFASAAKLGEEIVRCRDCKFYLEEHKWCYHFEDSEFCPEPDGFCAWGERRNA